jgi:hypothetical protein
MKRIIKNDDVSSILETICIASMRMLEIPFLILGEQMLLLRSNSGENPLMFIAPTVEFLKQVRDSPELDMVAGVDDSFNSQTTTHILQIFFSLVTI